MWETRERARHRIAHGPAELRPPKQGTALYLDVIRECYEAYVIYNFFMYLVAYLEDEYGDVDAYFSTKEDVQHLWGLHYLVRPWRMGEEFFWECKKVGTRCPGCSMAPRGNVLGVQKVRRTLPWLQHTPQRSFSGSAKS